MTEARQHYVTERMAVIHEYGQPLALKNAGDFLRVFGKRDEIHPNDAIAMLYPSVEAAEAFARLNRDHHDIDVLGPIPVPAGAVAVLDLRPQLALKEIPVTDPKRPDDLRELGHV